MKHCLVKNSQPNLNSQASGLKESGAKELEAADAKADQIHWKKHRVQEKIMTFVVRPLTPSRNVQ